MGLEWTLTQSIKAAQSVAELAIAVDLSLCALTLWNTIGTFRAMTLRLVRSSVAPLTFEAIVWPYRCR
jgi:hypothetical protein